MRLIDADALKFRDVKVTTNEIDILGFGGYLVEERKGILQEEIWNAPTIDAVPVEQCKNCVKRGSSLYYDGFCSDGERKDNG